MPVADTERFLNPNEAAEIVGLSTSTLAKLRCFGGGPRYFKLGNGSGRVRYRRSDLEDWAAGRAATSTSMPGGAGHGA